MSEGTLIPTNADRPRPPEWIALDCWAAIHAYSVEHGGVGVSLPAPAIPAIILEHMERYRLALAEKPDHDPSGWTW